MKAPSQDMLFSRAADLVLGAGAFIRREALHFKKERVREKSINSLVSDVDLEAERMLVEGLRQVLPGSHFITEENTTPANSGGQCWIIDPLDGTTNFIHGIPAYCVSVGFMEDGVMQWGMVYEVCREEAFLARRGGGATLNGHKIAVSTAGSLRDSLVATGFPYENFSYKEQYLRTLSALMEKTHGLRRIGTAALDLCYVACGRFEGYFEYNLNSWDVAAGSLIVQEAGGLVTDFRGGADFIFGKEILASNGLVHGALRMLI